MVSLQTIQQSNTRVAGLPKGLVALFIGATAGIGQSTLRQLGHRASSPRIYTVARPAAVAAHEELLATLRQTNPDAVFHLITADVSLISGVDKVVTAVREKESKLDILFMSPGFMPFDGRHETSEGLEPSMTTRYYSRQRAVDQLLPLLNAAPSPRVVSVLAGGMEAPLNEQDLDLKNPDNFSTWNANYHAATMSTLGLERVAQENSRLSITHWLPGPVATRGLAAVKSKGIDPPHQKSEEEASALGLFLATSDRYAVNGGLVNLDAGLEVAKRSAGGIFIINPEGDTSDNERVLSDMRGRGVDEAVWKFTQETFARVSNFKDHL